VINIGRSRSIPNTRHRTVCCTLKPHELEDLENLKYQLGLSRYGVVRTLVLMGLERFDAGEVLEAARGVEISASLPPFPKEKYPVPEEIPEHPWGVEEDFRVEREEVNGTTTKE
jgi:hypothetical protein